MSIRLRLILSFSLCMALAIGIICGIVFYFVAKKEEQVFHEMAFSQLTRVEERINAYMEPGIHNLLYLAGLSDVRGSRGKLTDYSQTLESTLLQYDQFNLQERRIYAEFIRLIRSNPNIARVFMGNADKQFMQAPDGASRAAGYDPTLRPWYRTTLQAGAPIAFTAPYVNSDNFMVCSIVVKTTDSSGRFLGVLGVDYRLKTLLADLDARTIRETGRLVIIDPTGRILNDGRHPERTFKMAEQVSLLWKTVAENPDGAFTGEGTDGLEKYIVSQTIKNLNWKVAVVFDRWEMLSASYSILRILLLTSALGLAIACLGGAYLARSIVRPMEQLVEASTIISEGGHEHSDETLEHLQELLDVKGSGEVYNLSMALTSLIITLEQRVDEARAASRAKSAFMANMSHEIRTPMNAVMGFTNLLLKSQLTDKQRGHAEKVFNAAKTLLSIIDDILDFSKIETSSLAIRQTPFNLTAVLNKVKNLFHAHSLTKNIPLIFEIAPDVPRLLIGDARRLHQILVNIVDNAFKFTETGQIAIQVSLAENGDLNGEVLLRFCVIDTGIGMSPAQVNDAFTVFSQLDNSSTRKYGGIGLGLALTRSLVKLMGGSIELSSREGEGTTATITCRFERDRVAEHALSESDLDESVDFLNADHEFSEEAPPVPQAQLATGPAEIMASLEAARDASAKSALPPKPDISGLSGFRILLVEDNELNILLAEEILHSAGMVTATAVNGEEALRLIDEADAHGFKPAFDAVLMDLQMPVLDGYDTTRRIRANPAHSDLIIIAMTAHAMEEERQRTRDSGMNEHLTKPIDAGELYNTLRRFLVKKDHRAH